jgi:hypothetical protein
MRPRSNEGHRDPGVLSVGYYVAGLLYTLAQGTFFHYHSIPATFGIGAMIAVLVRVAPSGPERFAQLALAVTVAVAFYQPAGLAEVDWSASGRDDGAVRLAEEIRAEVPPGERVQPIEMVGGVVDAMWRAEAVVATSFCFDIVFYHHVDRPIIAGWRRRFIEELAASRPYFLIETIGGYRARPYGPDAANSFPELDAWIRAHYVVHRTDSRFRWWRRRDD